MYTSSFEISAFLLSLFCLVYCLTAKRRQYIPPKGIARRATDQHFQFLMMLATNMVSSVASVVGVYLLDVTGPNIAFWQYFFHALYFIFHTTLSLAFGLYIIAVTGVPIQKNKKLYILFFLPYAAAEILILTNQWTNLCFFMNDTGYHRGTLMPLLYGLGAFYVLMGFLFFIRSMKAITKADSIAVGSFIVIATLGIVLQAVRSDILIELFAEALACLVIMMVLEEKTGHIDQMTGLLNRFAFSDNLRRMLSVKKNFDIVVVRSLDVDGLAKRYGDRAADAFLLYFATYLSEAASSSGTLYCFKRGEFVAIFKEPSEESALFARKVIERSKLPWKLGKDDIHMSSVAAEVHIPNLLNAYEEMEDLLSAVASYNPTQEGSYIIPEKEVKAMVLYRVYEGELKSAVENGSLSVYYQPIYSLKERKTVSAEALLRIPIEPFRSISPETYIPIAERSGLICDIGRFVFEDVCRFLSEEETKSSNIRYIELNLSVYQFLRGDLVEEFEAIRKRYDVDPSKINLEITETGGALNKNEIIEALNRFKALGYTLSLDDFGTGYSNIVRMVSCKFENIKIDKSILWNIEKEENGEETLRSLASFIKIQGSSIIQEGVETDAQLDMVRACGCDYVQGFYFSKALPKLEFLAYLELEEAK